MDLELLDWIMALIAAFSLGLSKSGIKGISSIIVTIMAIVFGGKASTGILIPLLIVGDIFAIIYYKRHVQWKYIYKLSPYIIIGILLGVWFGKGIPEVIFKQFLAGIIIFSVFMMIWWENKKTKNLPNSNLFAGFIGLSAGFTTMVGNLAGAFSNIYFLAMKLPKNEFIGTAAWLFFFMNLFKLPFHVYVWETVNLETVITNVYLIPGLILGFFAGIHLVQKINNNFFRKMIIGLTIIGAFIILLK